MADYVIENVTCDQINTTLNLLNTTLTGDEQELLFGSSTGKKWARLGNGLSARVSGDLTYLDAAGYTQGIGISIDDVNRTISNTGILGTIESNETPKVVLSASNVANTVSALANGESGTVLKMGSSGPYWSSESFLNPMTTLGDIIIGGTAGVATKLPLGTNGQVLTVSGTVPQWKTLSISANVSADSDLASGQVILGDGNKKIKYLSAASSSGSYTLSSVNGTIQWSKAMTNPMTANGDLIVGGTNGTPTRLSTPVSSGQYLTASAGGIGYAKIKTSELTNDSGYVVNPMTAASDLICGGQNGTPMRLQAATSAGKYLTATSAGIGYAQIKTSELNNDSGYIINPMTTAGDLIYGGQNGAATRLANNANENDFLVMGSGAKPKWINSYNLKVLKSNSITAGPYLTYRDQTTLYDLPTGTSGQVLTSQGAGATPIWKAYSGAVYQHTIRVTTSSTDFILIKVLSNTPTAIGYNELPTYTANGELFAIESLNLGGTISAGYVESGMGPKIHVRNTSYDLQESFTWSDSIRLVNV